MIKSILNQNRKLPPLIHLSSLPKLIYKFSSSQQQRISHGRNSRKKSPLTLQNLILPFPFQYTLQPSKLKYYDPRFNQQPIKKNLQSGEKEHIKFVMQGFQQYLNGKIKANDKQEVLQYLHTGLKNKVNSFFIHNKHTDVQVKFKFQIDNINMSQGYFQIQQKKTQKSLPTDYRYKQEDLKKLSNPQKFIHEYTFERQKQLLFFLEKTKIQKKSQQQLLKEDLKQILQQKTQKKQVRQMMQNISKPKQADSARAMNYLVSKLKSFGSKKQLAKKRDQEIYLISDLIKGNFNCRLFYKGQLITDEKVEMVTKWMYVVQGNQPETVRKSRKRVIYDFQFWNRGTFFPIKDFTQGV